MALQETRQHSEVIWRQMDERLAASKWALSMLPDELLKGARVLDVGCGVGTSMLAAAERGAERCVGVDLGPLGLNLIRHGIGSDIPNWFDAKVRELKLDRGQFAFIESDILKTEFVQGGFDLAVIFDVIEHVPDVRGTLQRTWDLLAPGGRCLISVAPLYYSQNGHHLFHVFPEAAHPWAHLYRDFDELAASQAISPFFWEEFLSLNKLTIRQLDAAIGQAGFKVVERRVHESGRERYPELASRIDARKVPSQEDLFIHMAQYVLEKPYVLAEALRSVARTLNPRVRGPVLKVAEQLGLRRKLTAAERHYHAALRRLR